MKNTRAARLAAFIDSHRTALEAAAARLPLPGLVELVLADYLDELPEGCDTIGILSPALASLYPPAALQTPRYIRRSVINANRKNQTLLFRGEVKVAVFEEGTPEKIKDEVLSALNQRAVTLVALEDAENTLRCIPGNPHADGILKDLQERLWSAIGFTKGVSP